MIASLRLAPPRSHARRSVYSELSGRPAGRCNAQPGFTIGQRRSGLRVGHQKGLAMVVIRQVVTMPMHRPKNICLEPMRMAMLFDHLQMLLNCLKHSWRMGIGWHHRPDDQRGASQHQKQSLHDAFSMFHGPTARCGWTPLWMENTRRCAAEQDQVDRRRFVPIGTLKAEIQSHTVAAA